MNLYIYINKQTKLNILHGLHVGALLNFMFSLLFSLKQNSKQILNKTLFEIISFMNLRLIVLQPRLLNNTMTSQVLSQALHMIPRKPSIIV